MNHVCDSCGGGGGGGTIRLEPYSNRGRYYAFCCQVVRYDLYLNMQWVDGRFRIWPPYSSDHVRPCCHREGWDVVCANHLLPRWNQSRSARCHADQHSGLLIAEIFSGISPPPPPITLCPPPPHYAMPPRLPPLQSTCHNIVNNYVKIWHVRLGGANNINPPSWGGGAQTEKIPPPPPQLGGLILFAPPRRTCHIFT